jgi:formate/nitrite transporter
MPKKIACAAILLLAAADAAQMPLLKLRGGGPVSAVATVKSPKETYDGMAAKGRDNAKMSVVKILHQSIMGGCYVGFGGLLSTVVAGNCGGIASSNPGLQKFIFAALFPVNLLLILMSGGQLFTGNSAAVPAALFEGLVDVNDLIRSWGVSYIGNIIGCGGFALAASYAGLLVGGTKDLAVGTVLKKCGSSFGPTVVKAIMCNWLVCMAVWLAGSANDLAGKMVGIWFPISTFVAIGFEHCRQHVHPAVRPPRRLRPLPQDRPAQEPHPRHDWQRHRRRAHRRRGHVVRARQARPGQVNRPLVPAGPV